MTLNQLASKIAKVEGKRSQARIGDIREILKIICVLQAEDTIARPDASDGPYEALSDGCNREIDRLHRKRKKGTRSGNR